ncbi:pyrroline-5-carboxylate reductase [Hahella sp. SMD15-11]|uniref:Pyrroline-5-carboxylate reductase n=1 Tax=Thermohahella caldifontis TaxID=3142973 RepID=A0AB39UV26_9GAMM
MTAPQITFIGAGNMASAIIKGLLASGFSAAQLSASCPDTAQLDTLSAEYGIATTTDNTRFTASADIVVLAVKPQIMESVCAGLRDTVQQRRPLIISIAAGLSSSRIETWLGGDLPVVRVMPNTPAQVLKGATGLFANPRVSEPQREQADRIFRAVGITEWFDDEMQLHAVTALSGSGPAYVFLFIEALEAAGVACGLPADKARRLAIQTLAGAAELAATSDLPPGELKRRVMSPGGTTEQAIRTFETGGFEKLVRQAVRAAWARGFELAGDTPPAHGND